MNLMFKDFSGIFYGLIFFSFCIALFFEKYALSAFFAFLLISNQLNDLYTRLSEILEFLKDQNENN